MRRVHQEGLVFGLRTSVLMLALALPPWLPSEARAQTGETRPEVTTITDVVPGSTITEPPATMRRMSYEEYELSDLKRRTRVTRNAFIGTAAAAGVGSAFLFPGLARQCVSTRESNGTSQLDCTAAGKALVGLGYPLFIGGLTGSLITGILLAVRKRKLHRGRPLTSTPHPRPLTWNPPTSTLVF